MDALFALFIVVAGLVGLDLAAVTWGRQQGVDR